jgi:hypothetical protein
MCSSRFVQASNRREPEEIFSGEDSEWIPGHSIQNHKSQLSITQAAGDLEQIPLGLLGVLVSYTYKSLFEILSLFLKEI